MERKELNDATCIDTSNLSDKRDFIALKAKIDKLDINRLVSVTTGLNNLKINVDDLNVGKLQAVTVDLKILNDVVSKKVVKKTVTKTEDKSK